MVVIIVVVVPDAQVAVRDAMVAQELRVVNIKYSEYLLLIFMENKFLNLTLTQNCNLSCRYCYELNKSKKSIDLDVAKSILDKHLSNLPEDEYMEVDLFGGEPFLVFDTLKEIVEYSEEKKYTRHCFFCAVTNGTLVHGEIQDWLIAHRNNITCSLSFDGIKKVQDYNRNNSFDLIDLSFFSKNYPNMPVKMTVSKEGLENLYESVVFCHNQGFEVGCNLAYGIDWSDENTISLLENQLMELIDFYLTHPEIKPFSLFAVPLEKVGDDNLVETFRQCGAGLNVISYDVDGMEYPCQFFMPLSVGDKAKKMGEIEFIDHLTRSYLDGECKTCIAAAICHICYGSNYAMTGDIYKKDLNWCKLQKCIFKAASYFQAKSWECGHINRPQSEVYYLLKGIKRIQEELN